MAEAWQSLPMPIRAAVVALVRTALPTDATAHPSGLDDTLPPGFERHTAPPG